MNPPWPHQQRGTDAILKDHVLLHYEMGCGKTRCVIDAIEPGMSVLILCPKSVIAVWHSEFEKWSRYSASELPDVTIVNYEKAITEKMQRAILSRTWTIVVLDESQRCKLPSGVTARFVHKLGNMARRRVCLTGTPMPHSPLDIWSQMRFLVPAALPSPYGAFEKRYAVKGVELPRDLPADLQQKLLGLPTDHRAHAVALLTTQKFKSPFRQSLRQQLDQWLANGTSPTPFSTAQWNALGRIDPKHLLKVVDYKNLDELQERIAPYMLQVKTADVLDLPGHQHQVRMVRLEPEAQATYDTMEKDLVVWLDENRTASASNVLVKLLRLMQITSGYLKIDEQAATQPVSAAKEEALEDILEDLGTDEPVVVFCLFRWDLDAVSRCAVAMGRKCYELSGRRNELASWQQDGGGSVLAVQIQSGGVGISLVRARYCIYYSLGFSLGNYLQSQARVLRPGQDRDVTYISLVASGTVDERVYDALDKRQEVVDKVLDGLRSSATIEAT